MPMTPQDAALLASLTGFTEGPWRHDSRQSGIDAPQSISPHTGKPARIALTLLLPHNLGSVDAENANAALIAAAPDLHRIATEQAVEIERLLGALTTCRAEALQDASDACTNIIKNYDVMKPDGKTYESLKMQKAAKGMVSLARQDIEALQVQP